MTHASLPVASVRAERGHRHFALLQYEKVMPLLPPLMIPELGSGPRQEKLRRRAGNYADSEGGRVVRPACALTEPISFVARES